MCLTLTGEVNKNICGAHGTCIDGECICDAGWSHMVDFGLTLAGGKGAEELFEENFGNGNSTSFKEYKELFIKATPCVGNETFVLTGYILGVLANLLCIGYMIYFPATRDKTFLYIKIITLFLGLIYTIIKILLGEKAAYPYFFSTSLLFAAYLVLMNTIISIYFYKYGKYHLEKAKLMYSLRVKFHGVDIERILKYQVSILFVVFIVGFSGTFFIPPFYLQIKKRENGFSFETMKVLKRFQEFQNLFIVIIALYNTLMTNIILGALLKDLKLLSEARTQNNIDKRNYSCQLTVDSRTASLNKLMKHTAWTNFILSAWFLNGASFFLCVVLIPGAEYLLPYLTPFQLGVFFPILCTLLK
eukprot:snap_masked-scaffold_85-processed-gene-0.14-mRNA-1 protein AED:1.00 eAED:1.00 QI:0/0/0/0/1/1/2/0/358